MVDDFDTKIDDMENEQDGVLEALPTSMRLPLILPRRC